MPLNLKVTPNLITPEWDRKSMDNMARKAGYKRVHGNLYQQRTNWKKFCDFISSSRAPDVVGKAHFESKQYAEAAVLRKSFGVNDHRDNHEIWNSEGVKKRVIREDFVRYHPDFVEATDFKSKRTTVSQAFTKVAHAFHGVCEMFASPTGMTYNSIRNMGIGKVDDKSMSNKTAMVGLLGGLGIATNELLLQTRNKTGSIAEVLGRSIVGVLIAFPAVSSAMGILGTVAGCVSQTSVKKQCLSVDQQKILTDHLSKNLQKILHRLKQVKTQSSLIPIMASAMQGKGAINKFGKQHTDENGIPKMLTQLLNSIDLGASDEANIKNMAHTLGEYLQVEKPSPENRTLWNRYNYCKKVKLKESHYVALASVVDHMQVSNPRAKELMDARRITEERISPAVHDYILKKLAIPAAVIDKAAGTQMAKTLNKWASQEYRDRQKAKLNDPSRAAKNKYRTDYMVNNIHQYKPVTRALIKIAEGMRIININLVLASNANLSRIFNNLARLAHNAVGTSPASRSMCNSIGRALGGAVLAIIFGYFIPLAADATGHPSSLEWGSKEVSKAGAEGGETEKTPAKFTISFTNIGILMFLLAVPTLAVQGLAKVAARVEGWDGNLAKQARPDSRKFAFPS